MTVSNSLQEKLANMVHEFSYNFSGVSLVLIRKIRFNIILLKYHFKEFLKKK